MHFQSVGGVLERVLHALGRGRQLARLADGDQPCPSLSAIGAPNKKPRDSIDTTRVMRAPRYGSALTSKLSDSVTSCGAVPRRAHYARRVDRIAWLLFGAPIALKLGAGLVPIRKPGKLPAATERVEYALEYATDALEMHQDAVQPGDRVLVVDDVLAPAARRTLPPSSSAARGGRSGVQLSHRASIS